MRSSVYIESAAQVLRKYTLDIDVKPFRAPAEFAPAFKGRTPDAKRGLLKCASSYYTDLEGGVGQLLGIRLGMRLALLLSQIDLSLYLLL
jgi:hypothetical protein